MQIDELRETIAELKVRDSMVEQLTRDNLILEHLVVSIRRIFVFNEELSFDFRQEFNKLYFDAIDARGRQFSTELPPTSE